MVRPSSQDRSVAARHQRKGNESVPDGRGPAQPSQIPSLFPPACSRPGVQAGTPQNAFQTYIRCMLIQRMRKRLAASRASFIEPCLPSRPEAGQVRALGMSLIILLIAAVLLLLLFKPRRIPVCLLPVSLVGC